jgi:hypothetical protein
MAFEAPCQAQDAWKAPALEGKGRALGGRAVGKKMAQPRCPGQGRGRHEILRNSSIGETKQRVQRQGTKQDQCRSDECYLLSSAIRNGRSGLSKTGIDTSINGVTITTHVPPISLP